MNLYMSSGSLFARKPHRHARKGLGVRDRCPRCAAAVIGQPRAHLPWQKVRIERCLDWLEGRVSDEGFAPGWFSIMDLGFICAMAYCEKREVLAWRGRPKLDALFDRSQSRPSLVATPLNTMPIVARYRVTRTPIQA